MIDIVFRKCCCDFIFNVSLLKSAFIIKEKCIDSGIPSCSALPSSCHSKLSLLDVTDFSQLKILIVSNLVDGGKG